ncbi:MAG: tetratricopeptide repeat protein [Thermodesulfovibrionales bacterium]|nr:tetratricopeptide repeat protein [Thermodesulfovibrionales bacterium]
MEKRSQNTENKSQQSGAEEQKSRRAEGRLRILKELLFYCFAALLFFLNNCATTPPIEQQKEADYHYKMGISFLNEGNIQTAFIQLHKAYQIDPDNHNVLNSLGLVHLQLEEFEKAKEFFLKALSINPDSSDAHHNLGIASISTGHFQDAADSFKKALSNPLYHTPEKSLYMLGVAFYRMKQYDVAINAFKDSIKRAPVFSLPYYGLALAYNKTGRYRDAATAIAKAIEIDPAYKGNRQKFTDDVKQRLFTLKGDEERDFRDYLEIIKY